MGHWATILGLVLLSGCTATMITIMIPEKGDIEYDFEGNRDESGAAYGPGSNRLDREEVKSGDDQGGGSEQRDSPSTVAERLSRKAGGDSR